MPFSFPHPKQAIVLAGIALVFMTVTESAEFRFSGSFGAEMRWFPEDPEFQSQLDHFQPSLELEPEFRWRLDNGSQFTLNPYLYLDSKDGERTHFDLREAYWSRVGEQWDILIGFNKVYWGVTESRHLVDMINQVDGVIDIDEEDRLGQPMINLTTQRDWGNIDFFLLTGFRERTFADANGRPRTELPVDTDHAEYESGAEETHIDYALRYTHFIGDWDIGAHFFYGTGREPHFTPSPDNQRLVPFYSIISQAGLDLQYTRDAWLWKLESIVREGQGNTFAALVGGFEYTFYQVQNSDMDLGIIAEYLHDGRDDDFTIAPPTIFEDDIFLGLRLAVNDIQDTSVLAGAMIDRDDQSSVFLVEAERRLGDSWKLQVEGRFFLNTNDDPVLNQFKNDSFITIKLDKYF